MANNRVQQHVEKGNDDELYISSVACCQDLWALIMDAGTGFAQQVYDLSNQVRSCAPPAGVPWLPLVLVGRRPWAGLALGCAQGLLPQPGRLIPPRTEQPQPPILPPWCCHGAAAAAAAVPAQGLDHGEVGGGLLHHSHGG